MSEHQHDEDRRRRRHDVARAVAAVLAVVGGLVLAPSAASAHGGDGVLEVGEPEPSGDLTYTVPVRVTYEADGHPVEPGDMGALTVDGSSPSGLDWAVEVIPMPGDAPGVYDLELTFPEPGTWQLTVRSAEPPAEAPLTVEVAEPTAATDTTAAPTETTAPPTTSAPDATDVTTGEGEIVERSEDDGAPTGLIVALVVCAVLVIAGGLVVRRVRAGDRVNR